MKVPIISVGNSRGIRLPKALIEQCRFEQEVNLEVEDHKLVISPAPSVRVGWREAFERMAEAGDDLPLLEDFPNDWDETEWEWK